MTKQEVRLQVRPSSYAEELLSRLNPHLRSEVHEAATIIQNCYRNFSGTLRLRDMRSSAIRIQKYARSKQGRAELARRRRMQLESNAAAKIQAAIRGHQCRLARVAYHLAVEMDNDGWQLQQLAHGTIVRAWKAKCLRLHISMLVRRRRRAKVVRRWKMPLIVVRQARATRVAAARLTLEDQRRLVAELELQAAEALAQAAIGPMQISFTIFECADLPSKDLVGGNDIYITLATADGQLQRTVTKDGAGSSAVWGGGDSSDRGASGERLIVKCGGSRLPNPTVTLAVYDEDIGSADDLIGKAVLALPLANAAGWTMGAAWYELEDHSGKPAGRIFLEVRLAPPEPEWGVRVVVYECRELRKISQTDQNDVQVQLRALDGPAQCTTVRQNGGASCQWAYGRGESFVFPSTSPPPHLIVDVLDEDKHSSNTIIGGVQIALPSSVQEWALESRWYHTDCTITCTLPYESLSGIIQCL